jgi:hypothetical protein
MEELLEAVFSMRSAPRLQIVNFDLVSSDREIAAEGNTSWSQQSENEAGVSCKDVNTETEEHPP